VVSRSAADLDFGGVQRVAVRVGVNDEDALRQRQNL